MNALNKRQLVSRLKAGSVLLFVSAGICFGQSTWEVKKTMLANTNLNVISFGNNTFVAGGEGDTILTSTDVATWQMQMLDSSLPSSYLHYKINIKNVIYGNNMFVTNAFVVTSIGDGRPATAYVTKISLDAGVLDYRLPQIKSIAFGQNKFVGLLWEGGEIRISSDVVNWDSVYQTGNQNLTFVKFENNLFFACGLNGALYTSPDGVVWTQRVAGTTETILALTYGKNQFVALCDSGSVLTSQDAITWTKTKPNSFTNITAITFGNNGFVAVGAKGKIITSRDAITWTTVKSNTTQNLNSVVFANNQFVAVGDSGTILTAKVDLPISVSQAELLSTVGMIGKLKIQMAERWIFATLPNKTTSGLCLVNLFDVSGKSIYSALVQSRRGVISVPSRQLTKGKYVMSITDNKDNVATTSFVLSR